MTGPQPTLATLALPAPTATPLTSTTTVALTDVDRQQLAERLAREFQLRFRNGLRNGAIAVSCAVAVGIVASAAAVSGISAALVGVAVVAVVIGASLGASLLVVSSAALDAVAQKRWARLAREHGLDVGVAARALDAARDHLHDEGQALIDSREARRQKHSLNPAAPTEREGP